MNNDQFTRNPTRRRSGLGLAGGASIVVALMIAACSGTPPSGPNDPPPPPPPPPPSATRLAFSVQPADGKAGDALSPAIQIALQDASGNVVSTATSQVTLAIGNNPGGATLTGTTEVAAVDGTATFDDLSLDRPGDGYTLTASASDLTGATSERFNLSAPFLSIEERQVVFDAVQVLMADLPGDDIDADKQVVLDFLAARPEFGDVGLSEKGTIWAMFTDGVPYFIMDNHTLALNEGPAPGERVRHSSGRPATVTRLPTMLPGTPSAGMTVQLQGGPSGLPKSNRFRLLNGFGDFFDETDPSGSIKQMLEEKGYADAGGSRKATVEVLRTVGANTAVLYFRSHGGNAILNDIPGTEVDGLWTATPVSSPEPDHIFDDMLAKRLGYATELNSRRLGLWPEEATHYMITAEFVKHYWGNFGENSLVYFDGCWGATMQTIKDALRTKNVSVYASWSHVSRSGPNGRTAKFVFDRLLGANQFEPEDPKQRPFDYEALAAQFGPGSAYGYDDFISPKTGNRITPTLQFSKLTGEFGLLAPSIQKMTVDEFTNELTLEGIFGKDPGAGKRQVTIADAPLTVKNWSEYEIVVSNLDPTAAGYVVVEALERPSNEVPLTRWEGQFAYEVDMGSVWAPGVRQDVTCNIHFRADVHGHRNDPGQAPIEPLVPVFPTESSTCQFTMSGSGTDDIGFTISSSGGGPMARADAETTPQNYFTGSGLIDVATKRIMMSLTLGAWGTIKLTPPQGETVTVQEPLVTDLWTLWGEPSCPPSIPPGGFELPTAATLNQGFGIESGDRSGTGGCGITDIPNTLQWGGIPATFPPMPDDRR